MFPGIFSVSYGGNNSVSNSHVEGEDVDNETAIELEWSAPGDDYDRGRGELIIVVFYLIIFEILKGLVLFFGY